MKSFLKVSLWAAVLVLWINSCSRGPENFRVFMVYSYSPEYNWVVEEMDGVKEVFMEQPIVTESFFMDTKRHTGEEWKNMMADSAMKMINEYDPDLIMVFDDNACEYVAKQFIGTEMPVVFCGMNADPSHYDLPAPNITGIKEKFPIEKMLEFLREIVPGVEKIAFISDKSPTSAGIDEYIEILELPVEVVDIKATNDIDEWKSAITAWQDELDAIGIITYHTITDTATGESMIPSDVMRWVSENSKLPDFSSFDFAVYDGVLCSYYVPGTEQGAGAAKIALKILNGKSPAEIPVSYPSEGVRLVNSIRAEKLGIEIPEGANVTVVN